MDRVQHVWIDLRKGALAFGMHHAILSDGERHNKLFMPEGFAHGFSALEDAIFIYKYSNTYHKENEGGVIWNDLSQI